MEVMKPSPALDFNFDSACTSPYITAPSSPQRFGNVFFSAPTSPTSTASFLHDFNSFCGGCGDDPSSGVSLPSTIPFNWEEKPGIPKAKDTNGGENDFEFDFSGQLGRTSLSADELFDGGKIKPLKPPPRLQQFTEHGINDSPRSPIGKKFFKEALSPRHKKKKDVDPFAAAMEQTCRESNFPEQKQHRERERERTQRQKQKGARSLSPFRVFDIFESESNRESSNTTSTSTTKTKTSSSSSFLSSGWKGCKKWSLKDLLLFRSASEGRATSKLDPLKNFSLLKKKNSQEEEEEVKNWSFRSTDSSGSVSRRRVSAHELHYTANRAVSEEMRKKTFLPYKRDLLGCLGFNPAVHDVFGSLTRG